MKTKIGFDKHLEHKSKNFTIVFEHHGEGYDGEYKTNDPDDRPLYRRGIFFNTDLVEPIRNGSFCTNITLLAPPQKVDALIQKMLQEAEEILVQVGPDNGGSIAGRLAAYSWKSDEDL